MSNIKNQKKHEKILLYALFAVYILFLLDIVVFKGTSLLSIIRAGISTPRRFNLSPFLSIKKYLTGGFRVSKYSMFINVFGNILAFVPLGIFIPIFQKKPRIIYTLIFSLGSTFLVELIQFTFSVGVFDIDDIILNFVGGMLGFIIFIIFYRIFKKDKNKTNSLFIWCSLILTLPSIAFWVVLFVNNL